MDKELIPFWEKTYQDKDIITFSIRPNPTVKEFEYLLNKQSNILEVGCGEGQNVLYLAQQGYCYIDAFDLSENAIAKVRNRCQLSGIQINAYVADLTTYQFKKNYDMIICFGTLHFVSKNNWKNFPVILIITRILINIQILIIINNKRLFMFKKI